MKNHTPRTGESAKKNNEWVSTKAMAQRLQISTDTLLRLAKGLRIPHLRAGRVIRYNPKQVEKALTQGPLK